MNRNRASLWRWPGIAAAALGLALTGKPASATLTIQRSLSPNYFSPAWPVGPLQASGSTLYGAAEYGFNGEGSLFSMSTSGAINVIHNFTAGASDGNQPWSGPLLIGGNLYGTTTYGGASGYGVIYKCTPGGTFSLYHTFTGTNTGTPANSDGAYPIARLVYNPGDQYLYGVTEEGDAPGSTHNQGTVYKIKIDGSGYTVIHDFFGSGTGETDTTYYPLYGLALDSSGNLWGNTYYASGYNGGIYKIKTDGTGYQFVYGFTGSSGQPYNPESDMLYASDGNLYFLTEYGGTYNFGCIMKESTSGGSPTILWSFDGYSGAYPYPRVNYQFQNTLYQGATDHNLYGCTSAGGAYGLGTLFKCTLAGVCTPITHFNYQDANGSANAPVQVGSSFYLTSYYGGITAATEGSQGDGAGISVTSAGKLKVIQNFWVRDLYFCYGGLVQDGSLYYGVAPYGGVYGNGGVFTINASGAYNVVHHFNNSGPVYEGSAGETPLFLNPNDHSLYGGTDSGGYYGYGTLFKMSSSGSYTKIRNLYGPTDGYNLAAALTVGGGTDKNLYGCMVNGGTAGGGTVFKTDTAGKAFTILKNFSTASGQPYDPDCTIVKDSSGNLWGACYQGGAHGYGCIFKMSTTGSSFTDMYDFDYTHGANPWIDRLVLTGTTIYATTQSGGTSGNGTLWSYSTTATQGTAPTIIHNFNNSAGDGYYPAGGVYFDSSNSTIYGTCNAGGSGGDGTVWSCTTSGTFTVLHSFTGYDSGNPSLSDGASPYEGVILGTDGLLHGGTYSGGVYNYGCIFTQTLTP